MISGNVPTGSGLSSSSALVVACSVAIMAVHNLSCDKADVAAFTCLAERHVGVSSGGMDQAISVMGQLGASQTVLLFSKLNKIFFWVF